MLQKDKNSGLYVAFIRPLDKTRDWFQEKDYVLAGKGKGCPKERMEISPDLPCSLKKGKMKDTHT